MAIKFNLTQNDEISALTAFLDGNVYTADNSHASWPQLVAAVTTADEDTDIQALIRLFDPALAVQDYFNKVSERVSVAGGHVFVDGDEVDGGLSDHILRFMNEDNTGRATALVNFLEKVMTNPNEHSRTQLYDWLSRYDFAINDEGNFLAYKGVYARGTDRWGNDIGTADAEDVDKYPYQSSSSGRAIVDGKVYEGRIPNGVGATVEMPRGDVQHDPSVGCHTGLHAGTWEYASTFTSGPVLLVEINPRDVVSVPTDCNWQKIRTCRYRVVEVVEDKLTSSYHGEEAVEDFSDDAPSADADSYDPWYGADDDDGGEVRFY
jgi:hypothetical protein